MGLILLEALGAMVLLVGIVWWTMFSGRKGGEIQPNKAPDAANPAEAAPPLPPPPSASAPAQPPTILPPPPPPNH